MPGAEKFIIDPRAYALDLVSALQVSQDTLIMACLNYMSHDDVRDMLDINELSPRFLDEDVED